MIDRLFQQKGLGSYALMPCDVQDIPTLEMNLPLPSSLCSLSARPQTMVQPHCRTIISHLITVKACVLLVRWHFVVKHYNIFCLHFMMRVVLLIYILTYDLYFLYQALITCNLVSCLLSSIYHFLFHCICLVYLFCLFSSVIFLFFLFSLTPASQVSIKSTVSAQSSLPQIKVQNILVCQA